MNIAFVAIFLSFASPAPMHSCAVMICGHLLVSAYFPSHLRIASLGQYYKASTRYCGVAGHNVDVISARKQLDGHGGHGSDMPLDLRSAMEKLLASMLR
jgi:hypothetical protein